MTRIKTKITMTELARLANVTPSTVSRALNDSPLVSRETRDEIVALAAKTGYVINASARSLRRQSSEAIGIVIPLRPESGQTISDPFFLEILGAVSHAASKQGFDLIVTVPEDVSEIAERRLLLTGRADGLIILGQAGRIERLNALGELSDKIVVWGGKLKGSTYTLVGSDNRLGGRLAAEHLIEAGRKRLLFIGDNTLPEVDLRFKGFLDAHATAGLRHAPARILSIDFGSVTAFSRIAEFLPKAPPFDAVFAASDVLAIAAIQALTAAGRRVPEDVSVVGYDNIGASALTVPGLTTVTQNIRLAGEIMVDLLIRKLAGETVQSRTVPTGLIVRESSIPKR